MRIYENTLIKHAFSNKVTVQNLSKIAGRMLPRFLFNFARSLGRALLTPILFSYRTGHFRSSLLNKAVDRHGNPCPWYTYSAVDFLMAKNLNDKHILEWGAGQSTLWWAKRAKSVLAFESSPEWHRYITQAAPANAQVYFTHDTIDDVDQHLVAEGFDIIVIDGLDRYKCAVKSINLISKDGAIILDNSDGFWGKEGEYPIIDFLRRNGFQRIDFYGYPAGVIQPHCTSIFFKSDCFLLTGREYPMRHC